MWCSFDNYKIRITFRAPNFHIPIYICNVDGWFLFWGRLTGYIGQMFTASATYSLEMQDKPFFWEGPELKSVWYIGLHTQKAYTHTDASSRQCVHQTLISMNRFGVRIEWRKYLNECTPSGYVSLWFTDMSWCGQSDSERQAPKGLIIIGKQDHIGFHLEPFSD